MKGLILLIVLALSTNAYTDTYNFMFTKPKKKNAVARAPETEDGTSDSETEEEETPKKKASESLVVGEKTPIVINNSNTFNSPSPVVAAAEPSSTTVQTIVKEPPRISPWRFGISGLYLPNKEFRTWSDPYHVNKNGRGGLIEMSWVSSPIFALTAYGGGYQAPGIRDTAIRGGIDAEVYLFTPEDRSTLSMFELAGIVGSLLDFEDTGTIHIHGGARLNVNFNPKFGLTGSARVSEQGEVMYQAGLITRL